MRLFMPPGIWPVTGCKGLPTVQAYGDGDDLVDDEAALQSLLGEGAPQGILISVAIGVAIKIAMRILKEIIA